MVLLSLINIYKALIFNTLHYNSNINSKINRILPFCFQKNVHVSHTFTESTLEHQYVYIQILRKLHTFQTKTIITFSLLQLQEPKSFQQYYIPISLLNFVQLSLSSKFSLMINLTFVQPVPLSNHDTPTHDFPSSSNHFSLHQICMTTPPLHNTPHSNLYNVQPTHIKVTHFSYFPIFKRQS